MNKTTWAVLGIVVVILVVVFGLMGDRTAAPGTQTENKPQQTEKTVTLASQSNSGESGTATITEEAGKAKVTVVLTGAPAAAQPAHIHTGSCPTPGAVKYPLTNVVNGRSETVLTIGISELMGQLPLAVNVHKSSADLKTYVACGNIK